MLHIIIHIVCNKSKRRRIIKLEDLVMVFNRNRLQVFSSKCGPSAMSTSPSSSGAPRILI